MRRQKTPNIALDRELIRSEDTYTQIRDDPKWNAKTIKLAFQFMKLHEEYAPLNDEAALHSSYHVVAPANSPRLMHSNADDDRGKLLLSPTDSP